MTSQRTRFFSVLVSLFPLHALATSALEVGDQIPIAQKGWVMLAERTRNSNVSFPAGDTCMALKHGVLKILKLEAGAINARVSYSTPQETAGTLCPSGAELLISVAELERHQRDYPKMVAREKEQKEIVEASLVGKPPLSKVRNLSVGQVLRVPQSQWVTVRNPVPVRQNFRNAVEELVNDGETHCLTEFGGSVKILGFFKDETTAIVEYSAPGLPIGTPCPSSVLYFEGAAKLELYSETYLKIVQEQSRVSALRNEILEKKSKVRALRGVSVGDRKTVPDLMWVTVANASPVKQRFANGDFRLEAGEVCAIEKSGTLTVLGFDEKKFSALVRYETTGNPRGTRCPTGVIFFISLDDLTRFR